MQLFKTIEGALLLDTHGAFLIHEDWDSLLNHESLFTYLKMISVRSQPLDDDETVEKLKGKALAPIGSQEVWAAGVTYLRSRDARMEESEAAGGADFYQKVYEADRPELFFKALPQRVAAPGEEVYIRKDSSWNVPEPEFTLFINARGQIAGYTIGNDMSSRSIEGENPLYLPQAKTYERSAALGPCLYITQQPLPLSTQIAIRIEREQQEVFAGAVELSKMKRTFTELADWLFRECHYPKGVFLMTGTGIVPPDHFTLQKGDRIAITVQEIGTLVNVVGENRESTIDKR